MEVKMLRECTYVGLQYSEILIMVMSMAFISYPVFELGKL
jgi:hypothetical protein